MKSIRKTEISFGLLYIAATLSGILSVAFSGTILKTPLDLSSIAANSNQILLVAFLEFCMAFTVAGIAYMIYPVLKKDCKTESGKGLAIWYLGTRISEGVLFLVGVLSVLSLLKLSHVAVAIKPKDMITFQAIASVLFEASEYCWMLGQSVFCIGAMMFYNLLYKSNRIPCWLARWGFWSAPLMFIAGFLPLFGIDSKSLVYSLLCLPMAVQEMVLAVWVLVKGFNHNSNN